MRRYQIRVELDERFEPEDVRLDLRTNELHPLHKHDPYIAVSHCGGAMFTFDLTAVDLWTAILTTMALVRHCGYVPTAVEAAAPRLGFSILLLNGSSSGDFSRARWLVHRRVKGFALKKQTIHEDVGPALLDVRGV